MSRPEISVVAGIDSGVGRGAAVGIGGTEPLEASDRDGTWVGAP